jgi:hypothetical protein
MQVTVSLGRRSMADVVTLIHRMQRERGATAAWVARQGNSSPSCVLPCQCGTGSLVADLRRRTDRQVAEVNADIVAELSRVRKSADCVAESGDPGASAKCEQPSTHAPLPTPQHPSQ